MVKTRIIRVDKRIIIIIILILPYSSRLPSLNHPLPLPLPSTFGLKMVDALLERVGRCVSVGPAMVKDVSSHASIKLLNTIFCCKPETKTETETERERPDVVAKFLTVSLPCSIRSPLLPQSKQKSRGRRLRRLRLEYTYF